MNYLEEAIKLSTSAHYGQRDKGGQPYILHPLRVMMQMETEEEKIIAVLHDTIEDSLLEFDDLSRRGFSDRIVGNLQFLTRGKGVSYQEYLERLRLMPMARRVKIADLEDNLDITRIPSPEPKDFKRMEKYIKAYEFLKGKDTQ